MKAWMIWPATWLAAVLTGCTTDEDSAEEQAVDGYPPGTVEVSPGRFMVPLDQMDNDGCQGYRVVVPGQLTVQAIYYRRPDGSFTVNKMEADCYRD